MSTKGIMTAFESYGIAIEGSEAAGGLASTVIGTVFGTGVPTIGTGVSIL